MMTKLTNNFPKLKPQRTDTAAVEKTHLQYLGSPFIMCSN